MSRATLAAAALRRARAAGRRPRALHELRCLASAAAPRRRHALVLVLDLDETLIRASCRGVHKNRELPIVDFSVEVDIGQPPESVVFECNISTRPGLRSFFDWIVERRSSGLLEGPWLFTTAISPFVKAVLERLDPDGGLFGGRVLTRDACQNARMPGFQLKDLAVVPSGAGVALGPEVELRRRVLVDNNPVSCVINPGCGLLVRDWLGADPEDAELHRVRRVLDEAMGVIAPSGGLPEGLLAACEGDDYAGRLARLVPGHGEFQRGLRELGTTLDVEPPEEIAELKRAILEASAEAKALKRQLLGAEP